MNWGMEMQGKVYGRRSGRGSGLRRESTGLGWNEDEKRKDQRRTGVTNGGKGKDNVE